MSDPSLLLHPNIPKPLHGISPRTVLGKRWWNVERKKAYAKAGFCCEACGTKKEDALYHQWLEAHEFYEYDYEQGRLRLLRLVALCHACHNYIHSGRLHLLTQQGKISVKRYNDIMERGDTLLAEAGLLDQLRQKYHSLNEGCLCKWEDWRMEIEGKLYGPSSDSYFDWLAGAWRRWKP